MEEWVTESSAVGVLKAFTYQTPCGKWEFYCVNSLVGFLLLVFAWGVYKEPSDWLGILIASIIVLLPYLYFARGLIRVLG